MSLQELWDTPLNALDANQAIALLRSMLGYVALTRAVDVGTFSARTPNEAKAFMAEVLTPTQLDVLTRRFGLAGDFSISLEEMGQLLRQTRERVRQHEAKALRILRDAARQ